MTILLDAATGNGDTAEHTTDGSRVTLTIEGATTGFIKNIHCVAGLKIRASRTADVITMQWRRRLAGWQSFASGDLTFAAPNAEAITLELIDP